MGRTVRTVIGALLLIGTAACGDPFVIVGDSPGVVRIVAGVATVAGDSIAPRASESELNEPRGLAVDAAGTLLIADKGNRRIIAVTSADEIEIVLDHSRRSRGDPSALNEPDGLTLDADGRLIIADPASQRLFALDPDDEGTFAPLAGTGMRGVAPDTAVALQADLREPTGVAVAADGRIYFTEKNGHLVRRLDADGRLITIAGTGDGGFAGDGGPATAAQLFRPAGLAIGDGVLYIADSGNQRVRAVNLAAGTIETVAGSGGRGFAGDGGPATDAFLDEPLAVATADGSVSVFIADTGNHRVRVVNLRSGGISTFAGTGDTEFNGDMISAGETGLDSPLGLTLSPFRLLFIADTGHHVVLRTAVGFLTAE